jgi:hypothetical protein
MKKSNGLRVKSGVRSGVTSTNHVRAVLLS